MSTTMTRYYRGQEVEVQTDIVWRKAKLSRQMLEWYVVELRDGSRAVVDADHIRAEYAQAYPSPGQLV
jgi:hypothetical protein